MSQVELPRHGRWCDMSSSSIISTQMASFSIQEIDSKKLGLDERISGRCRPTCYLDPSSSCTPLAPAFTAPTSFDLPMHMARDRTKRRPCAHLKPGFFKVRLDNSRRSQSGEPVSNLNAFLQRDVRFVVGLVLVRHDPLVSAEHASRLQDTANFPEYLHLRVPERSGLVARRQSDENTASCL